ncbi:MAG: TonB family protein [Bdellovibrionales bacterium]
MARFFLGSVFLHGLFVAWLLWCPVVPLIEDPEVSVTLRDKRQPGELRRAPRAATKLAAPNSEPPKPELERISENSNIDSTPQSNSGPVGIGNVSVKPRVLRSFKATYPEAAKQARVEGPVRISILINTKGQVEEAEVLEGPGYGLNETALEALRKFLFSPAEQEGRPVAVRIVYVYRFRLESR